MVVIGGLGSLPGALLGAIYVQSTDWFRNLWPNDLRPLLTFLSTGVGLLVVLMVLPGGLGSVLYRIRDAALRRIAARRGILVPSLVADQDAASSRPTTLDATLAPAVHAGARPRSRPASPACSRSEASRCATTACRCCSASTWTWPRVR